MSVSASEGAQGGDQANKVLAPRQERSDANVHRPCEHCHGNEPPDRIRDRGCRRGTGPAEDRDQRDVEADGGAERDGDPDVREQGPFPCGQRIPEQFQGHDAERAGGEDPKIVNRASEVIAENGYAENRGGNESRR